MSDLMHPSAYQRLELAKAARMGSYAPCVIYSSTQNHVCPLCGGPKNASYALCLACDAEAQQARALRPGGVSLADTVRFGHYACKGEQMYRVMQGYKNATNPAAAEYQTDIKYIAADALAVHYPCIGRFTGSMLTAWATIPSTQSSRNYGKRHILTDLVAPFMAHSKIPQLHLNANAGKVHNRINPQIFSLAPESQHLDLAHVLLIEDSWASGATVQSVAAMLRLHGAAYITVYCMARIIDLSWIERSLGKNVADGYRQLTYQNRCPWSLDHHFV